MKYWIIFLCLFSFLVPLKAQDFKHSTRLGVKYYVFADWGFDYLRPSLFSLQHDWKISESNSIMLDCDFFDLNTNRIDREKKRLERLNLAYRLNKPYIRYFLSAGLAYCTKIWKDSYLSGGLRYRDGDEFILIDYIVHNPISTTITEYSPSIDALGLQLGMVNNWSLFHKRLAISLDYSLQFFHRKPLLQTSLGLHLGYNFGKNKVFSNKNVKK